MVGPLIPAFGQIDRLKMGNMQTIAILQTSQQRAQGTNFLGNLIDDIQSFRAPLHVSGSDESRTTANHNSGWATQRFSQITEEVVNVFWLCFYLQSPG